MAGCLLLVTICVVTRIVTSLHSSLNSGFVPGSKEVGVVPYSIPWLGSALSFGMRFQDFLAECQYVDCAASSEDLADLFSGNAAKIPSLRLSWLARSTTS